MAAKNSLVDKAFKVVSMACAAATVVGLSSLAVNIYLNTGKNRKPMPMPEADSATATDAGTDGATSDVSPKDT